jgi:hypothetical protein
VVWSGAAPVFQHRAVPALSATSTAIARYSALRLFLGRWSSQKGSASPLREQIGQYRVPIRSSWKAAGPCAAAALQPAASSQRWSGRTPAPARCRRCRGTVGAAPRAGEAQRGVGSRGGSASLEMAANATTALVAKMIASRTWTQVMVAMSGHCAFVADRVKPSKGGQEAAGAASLPLTTAAGCPARSPRSRCGRCRTVSSKTAARSAARRRGGLHDRLQVGVGLVVLRAG